MTIQLDKLLTHDIPEVEQRLTRRDTILYALGVGLGSDPVDVNQLRFVYEQGLQALPTMAIILGYPGPWHTKGDFGITRSHVVHGEQGLRIVKPLPVEGDIVGKTRITGVVDKGKDKGKVKGKVKGNGKSKGHDRGHGKGNQKEAGHHDDEVGR